MYHIYNNVFSCVLKAAEEVSGWGTIANPFLPSLFVSFLSPSFPPLSSPFFSLSFFFIPLSL